MICAIELVTIDSGMSLDLCMTQAVEAYLRSQEERDLFHFRCQYDHSEEPPTSISVWEYSNVAKPSCEVLKSFLSQAKIAKEKESSMPPAHLRYRTSMRAVKVAETDWSLGAVLTPGQVLRLGISSAQNVEVTVRLVVNGVKRQHLRYSNHEGRYQHLLCLQNH